ncbi:GNAT family N-acetyltransferase [Jiella marina]|uniref:GNAT family N-acetyltransferase n=1 Tax=Jiella sp. LLJ827 TaxID=2917712 RepID=UPI002100EEB7|nr:GNAT family N-acetyltransferase [Jiella sp. LLJ827]MCQ0987401.1 GNAT family N-acetyltransferase [Jiella sp. LLJ827]
MSNAVAEKNDNPRKPLVVRAPQAERPYAVQSAPMADEASRSATDDVPAEMDIAVPRSGATRRFSVYRPEAAFALIDELKHLSRRAIEPNVFFDPRFLVPAMPRLDERSVRLMVVRDEGPSRSRLRLLMPYTTERTFPLRGIPIIRAWAHPFGRLGTLPLDSDDPHDTLASFFQMLTAADVSMPEVLVLPETRTDGSFAEVLRSVTDAARLPVRTVNEFTRAGLLKSDDAASFEQPVSARRLRELRRQRRLLKALGPVSFHVAREPEEVRLALEEFLNLEARGWKGKARSAMVLDRYRAAFAREAVNALGAEGRARIFSLSVGERTVASLVTLIDGNEAFAWKMAYDETLAKASPGQQVVCEATRAILTDPALSQADSCAMPDHFVMNRFWSSRIPVATYVIGLKPGSDRTVELAARGILRTQRARNTLRLARRRLQKALSLD